MKEKLQSPALVGRVAQNAPGPPKRQSRTSNRKNAARRPSYRCFLICPLTFSTRCVDLSCTTLSSMPSGRQIFSLVHPRDLMRISWTSKTLNEFLTSKSSRHVWQASFKMVPESEKPPPCPSEITEMAYANLLYGQGCMVCVPAASGLARSSNYWLQICADVHPAIPARPALVRLCGRCIEEMYFLHFLSAPFGHSMIPPRAIDLYAARPDGFSYGTNMSEVLPTFRVKCACIFPWNSLLRGLTTL